MRFTNLTRDGGIGANCYRLDLEDGSIILDSGMHPERVGQDSTPLLELLADADLRSILLTHAHQDHVGCLPLLQSQHPSAPVLMTAGTARIADVMLHNSVNVMNRQQEQMGLSEAPLYSHRSIDMASRHWRACPLEKTLTLEGERTAKDSEETTVSFHDAGHILGSAGIMIRSEGRSFFYTGDVNFQDQTLLKGAAFPEETVDVLMMETTRGAVSLPGGFTRANEEVRFGQAVAEALEEGASVTIPVFALGKTQEIMALLWRLQKEGVLPASIPLYVGGLSSKITAIYDSLAPLTARNLQHLRLMDAMSPYIAGGRDIQSLNPRKRAIYALSSGMMSEHTLSNVFVRKVLPEPQQRLFFVGYADPNSPAGMVRSAEPGSSIRFSDEEEPIPFRCHREEFIFSAHSRREDLLEYAVRVRPKTVLLVHGDAPAIEWFRNELHIRLPESQVLAPAPGEAIEL